MPYHLLRISVLFVLAFVLFARDSRAQWETLPMTGIYPGAGFFAIMDSTLCASFSYFSRTTDNGDTWSKILSPPGPTCLTDYGRSYLAGTKGAVYLRGDRDSTWTKLGGLPFAASNITGIATKNNWIFAVADYLSVVMRSNDTGRTWESTAIAPPLQLTSLGTNARYVFAAGMLCPDFDSTFPGVFRSSDSGKSWRDVSCREGLTRFSSRFGSLLVSDSLIVVSSEDAIFYSIDDGDTWQRSSIHWDKYVGIRKLRSFNNGYIALTDEGICWSSNGGRDWYTLDNALPEARNLDVIVHEGNIFIGTEAHIYRRSIGQLDVKSVQSQLKQPLKLRIAHADRRGNKLVLSLEHYDASALDLDLLDVRGSVVLTGKFSNFENPVTLSVESLHSGIYFARVRQAGEEAMCKYVIER